MCNIGDDEFMNLIIIIPRFSGYFSLNILSLAKKYFIDIVTEYLQSWILHLIYPFK